MKRKGFTLIELLAVIVILAVIALIATPMILGVIENAKRGAAIDSVHGILKAGEEYQVDQMFEQKEIQTNIDLTGDILTYDGGKPDSGTLLIDEKGNMSIIAKYGKYCVEKKFNEIEPKVVEREGCEIEPSELLPPAELKAPTYEVSDIKWSSGNVDVTITYGAGIKLFKTTVGVTSNIDAVKCDSVNNGAYTCEGEETRDIEARSWYKVEENPVLTFRENGSVIAQIIDGSDYKTGSSITIGNIDNTAPSITIETSNVKTDRVTVNAVCEDNESGIAKYEFSMDNGATWINGGTTSNYTFTGLTKETTYTFKARCTNGAGGISEIGKDQETSSVDAFIATFTSIGANHSMAIDEEGNLWDWGSNGNGQLGDGTTTNRANPTQIKEGTKFKIVSAGYNHSMAIDEEGNLWGWGSNGNGQLGDGTAVDKTSPVQIKEGTKFKSVSAGTEHTMAIDEEGNLWGWGSNSYGQLGDGTAVNKTSPVQIKEGTKFKMISSGEYHTMAIDEEGNLWGWGYNTNGTLGDGTTTGKTSPVQIKEGTRFKMVSAGTEHTMAIDEEGNLWGWGYNIDSRLGDGTSTRRTSPVQIKEGTKFKMVSVGWEYTMAIDEEGNLWGWGSGDYGILGDGTGARRTSPVQIKEGTKFKMVSAGWNHTMAIDEKGNLWGCGYNGSGKILAGAPLTIASLTQIMK